MAPDYNVQPAQKTQLGEQARGFLPGITSPDIGLVTYTSIPGRPKNAAAALTNLHFINGAWTNENTGWSKHVDIRFPATVSLRRIYEMGAHFLADGTQQSVVQVETKLYKYDLSTQPAPDPTAATLLFTATSASIPCMRSFSPTYFSYVNGVDAPQKWDGTTWAAASGWPVAVGGDNLNKPKVCEPFAGRMAFANFDGFKYRLVISDFDDPETFTLSGSDATRGAVYNIPTYLGEITGLRSLKISNDSNEEVLVIGCQKGVAYITGTDANSFDRRVLTSNYGVLSNRTWVQLDNDLYFFATDGIRRLSSAVLNANLLNSSLTYAIQDIINRANLPQFQQAFALHNPKTLEVVFWFPIDANIHNRNAIVMNYGTSEPAVDGSSLTLIPSFKETPQETSTESTWKSPSCGLSFKDKLYCGGYNGYVQDHYNTDTYDGSTNIFVYRSPTFDPPTPAQAASNRLFNVLLQGTAQDFTLAAYVYETMQDGSLNRVKVFERAISISTAGGTALDAWVLGTGAFPAESFQIVEFLPPGQGRAWEIEITGATSTARVNFLGVFSTLEVGGTRQ